MIFKVNPNANIKVEQFADDYSCVVVDDFFRDPEDVVALARNDADDFFEPPFGYPGLMLHIDNAQLVDVYRYFRKEMSKKYSFLRGGMRVESLFAIATLQPDELSNFQRICHTDPTVRHEHEHFAALVYLFQNDKLGGTAFYRWKESALLKQAEALELKDPVAALSFLKKHFPTFEKPPSYMTESNEIADLIGMVPARFNRMIFYPGYLPHSAYIYSPELLTGDLASGRLTLNCFASVRAA